MRKRDTSPLAVLQRVIPRLERRGDLLGDVRARRHAVQILLEDGPLDCAAVLARERETPTVYPADPAFIPGDAVLVDVDVVALELMKLLREIVSRRELPGAPYASRGIQIGAVTRYPASDGPSVRWRVDGSLRDVAILQFVELLDREGIASVRQCAVAGCGRVFVRHYRQEFCSVRCQQRSFKRRLRAKVRADRERAAYRRHLRKGK